MFERRAYLLDMTRRVPTMRTAQELIDVLARYRYNEFRPFAERDFPEGLDFGKLGAYCEMQGVEMVKTTRNEFEELFVRAEYAVVSTEAERSLAGRVEDMREQMTERRRRGVRGRRRVFL